MTWRQYRQPTPFDLESLIDLLRDRQRELDALGDWADCREWLNNQDVLLAETRQATKMVDVAFQEKDTGKVKKAVETYSQTWRRVFAEYHAFKIAPQTANETQGILALA